MDEKEKTTLSKDEIVRKCEIAYITGQMEGKGEIVNKGYDMYQMYDNIYEPVYNEWTSKDKFKNEDEEAYITEYAQRRLKEIFEL